MQEETLADFIIVQTMRGNFCFDFLRIGTPKELALSKVVDFSSVRNEPNEQKGLR